jgi:hypothetical protein
LKAGVHTYAYAKGNPASVIDSSGLLGSEAEEAYRLKIAIPAVIRMEAKGEICRLLNAVNPTIQKNWLQNALVLEVEARTKFGWDISDLREADNFLEAAGFPYTMYNNTLGVYIYQYSKKVPQSIRGLFGLEPSDTSFSQDALDAGLVGLSHQYQTKHDIEKWCNSCDRR